MAKKDRRNEAQDLDRDDKVELNGIVEDAMPGTLFKVKCDNDHVVIATLSGKLRQNHIRILPGDYVVVEVSPYDLSRGRISWRK